MLGLYWYIDRWRQSAAYTDMTVEEQGAYRNLLDEGTLRDGALPNDEKVLAKACGDPRIWRRVRVAVLAKFSLGEDGCLHNDALDQMLASSQKRIDRQQRYRDRLAQARNGVTGDVTRDVTQASRRRHDDHNNSRSQDQDQDQDDGSIEQNHQEGARPSVVPTGGIRSSLSWHRQHGHHVDGFCGWKCMPGDFVEERAGAHGGPGPFLTWAQAVRQAYGDTVPTMEPWDFWKAAYREATRPVVASDADRRAYADYVRAFGPGRYGETKLTLDQFVARRAPSALGVFIPRLTTTTERTGTA